MGIGRAHDQVLQLFWCLDNIGKEKHCHKSRCKGGEHPDYDANYISDTVRKVYETKVGHGEIRRVNINAAPMDRQKLKTTDNKQEPRRMAFSNLIGGNRIITPLMRLKANLGLKLEMIDAI